MCLKALLVLLSLAQHAYANQQSCPIKAGECTHDAKIHKGLSLMHMQASIGKGFVEDTAEDPFDAPMEESQTEKPPTKTTSEEPAGDSIDDKLVLDKSALLAAGQDKSALMASRRRSRSSSRRRSSSRSKFASGSARRRAARRRGARKGGPAHRNEKDIVAAQASYLKACVGKKIGTACSVFNGVYKGKCTRATTGENKGQVECQKPTSEEPMIKACAGKKPGGACTIKKEGRSMPGHCAMMNGQIYCQPAGLR